MVNDPDKPLVAVTFGEGGTRTEQAVTPNIIKGMVAKQVKEQVGEVEKSRAQQRYEALSQRSESVPQIVSVNAPSDPEPWYIKRINIGDLTLIGIFSARNSQGRLALTEKGTLTSIFAATLFVCVVCGPDDDTPFFESFEEAYQQADANAPAMLQVNSVLTAQIHSLNPEIMAAAGAQDAAERGAVEDLAPLAKAATSTVVETEMPHGGTGETASNDESSSLPTGS